MKTGLYGFQEWAGRKEFEQHVTLPEHFRLNGYNTYASGKIHHGHTKGYRYTQQAVEGNLASPEPDDPEVLVPRADREWTENNLAGMTATQYHHQPCMEDCLDWSGPDNPKEGRPNSFKLVSGPSDEEPMNCMDGATVHFGLDVLSREHDKPFFLALGFVRPHLPFIVPRKYFEPYPLESLKLLPVKDDDLADQPWVARRNARVSDDINIHAADSANGRARVIQAYYACTSFVDEMIGKVIDALDASGHADNTVIVLWSDHGWHLGEKRSWRKFSLWEESARTPMMIVDPRRGNTAGQTCHRPVGLIDLYPTLTELCGLKTPAGLDGASLRPLLDEPELDTPETREPELTIQGRGNYSFRDETWRYTRYFDGSQELFNHVEDPFEWENLAGRAEYGEVLEAFRSRVPKSEETAETFEPRGFCIWADEDLSDMEQFREETWPKWLKQAVPPLL
jgi:arylsulfatase A-like enzyme